MQYDEFPAMNTTVQVAAEGDPNELQPGFQEVRRFVAQAEARFSRFRETSELSRLNRSTGKWFQASPSMFEMLQSARTLHNLTDGLFDPSILPALCQAGYDRSMDVIRQAGVVPGRIVFEMPTASFDEVCLDPHRGTIWMPDGLQIDLGGIAKGWIATRAASGLLQYTDVCAVSAGGDMALFGLPAGSQNWEISLEDPLDPDQVIAILRVLAGGLATSTVTRRQWVQDGRSRHHIIDPRSGEPAISEWLSVTVSAPSAVVAEVFAKALLIAGPAEARTLASRMEGLRYAAVGLEGNLIGTLENMERFYVPQYSS